MDYAYGHCDHNYNAGDTENYSAPGTQAILGTLRYGNYGLRAKVDARFSLAETLGRVRNEWRENAKLRPQTTDYERRAKVNSTLNRHKISFKRFEMLWF